MEELSGFTGNEQNAAIKKTKIVVGMNGGVDSVVTAILLKKQGFEVLGVYVILWTREHFNGPTEDDLTYHKEQLEKVRTICLEIGIQFYATDTSALYRYQVIEELFSRRFQGNVFCSKNYYTQVLIESLYEKMIKLEANGLATGHFAKVHFESGKAHYFLMAPQDIRVDQSHELALVSHEILPYLKLPLGELNRSEVNKLVNKLELVFEKTTINFPIHEWSDQFLLEKIKTYVHSDFLDDEGPVAYLEDFSLNGTHHGAYKYRPNTQDLLEKENMVGMAEDQSYIGYYHQLENTLIITPESYLECQEIPLTNLNIDDGWDQTKPLSVFFKRTIQDERIIFSRENLEEKRKKWRDIQKLSSKDHVLLRMEKIYQGQIIFKNNQTGILRISGEREIFYPGEFLVFYNQKDKGQLVIGHGEARHPKEDITRKFIIYFRQENDSPLYPSTEEIDLLNKLKYDTVKSAIIKEETNQRELDQQRAYELGRVDRLGVLSYEFKSFEKFEI